MSKPKDKVDVDVGQRQEMKLGEYFLHVFVEESSQLAVSEGKAENIAVRLTAFGETKYSKVRENITSDSEVYYGDHHFFVKIFDDREILENENLEITVLRKGLISKEIGSATLNISAIYFEENHTIKHKWFVLQDKSGNFQKAQGYLKVSINLSADADDKVYFILQGRINTRDNRVI